MLNLVANGSSGYNLTNSLRFRSSASAYLNRTPASTPTSWTLSLWVKRGTLGSQQALVYSRQAGTTSTGLFFNASDQLEFNFTTVSVVTSAVFRDPSAWYHVVTNYNGTTYNIYVNGNQQTTTGSSTGANTFMNSSASVVNAIGKYGDYAGYYFDGYLAEVNFIDGQALTPSSFGSTNATTGVWQPAKYTGTYGTNGFYLNFNSIALTSGSNTGLGKDSSGNGNYWTTNNISVTAGTTYDAMTDVPTLTSATVANYATMNPLKNPVIGTYSNANLTVAFGTNDFTPALATIYPTSGKWYWEAVWVSGTYSRLGVQNTTVASTDFGADSGGWRWGSNDGQIYNGGLLITVSTYATGDVLGFCLDLDAGKLYVSKNGTWQNSAVPASGTGAVATNIPTNTPMSPAGSTGYQPTTNTWNFGQRPFAYTPPSGFVALNTYNLPTSTIVKGNSYMNAVTYTGSASNVTVTSGFYPDLTWAKSRNNTYNNSLIDSNRGGNAVLFSNLTNAESTVSGLATFSSTGVTYLAGASGVNADASTNYVLWAWNAGAGSTSSNTSGSITSTVSVNATAGFSVVTYTNTAGSSFTVGHGLGVAPAMIIIKLRNLANNWNTYHKSLGAGNYIALNTTAASTASSTIWNNTAPTSSVFSLGSDWNLPTYTSVAYCWAEIAGFSKFGSYTGNGSADGPFIFTGFRPKWILIKNASSSVQGWTIQDTSRSTYNVVDNYLLAQATSAEQTIYAQMDYLSNGFKVRTSDALVNGSGNTIIYMAFAENPFKNANAR